jgi:hypothetical protein
MGIIEDLAQQYKLIAKIDTIGPMSTGTPYMTILDKDGQRRFNIRKLANKFYFYKIVYKPNVIKGEPESVLHGKEWNDLVKAMHVQFATLDQPTMTTPGPPTSVPEHNGITPEENEQIKEAVDSYGDKFWTEYVKASMGQTAYVEVFYKPAGPPADLIFSIGALGNFYQINGPDNKPKENPATLNGVIARIHDMLADKAGQVNIDPKDLDEIVNLTHQMGFDYTPPEGDEPYIFVDDDNIIEVKHNAVWYTIGGVFGPVYTKNSKVFINWFKNIYMLGKVPQTGMLFAQNILSVLDSAGFVDKSTGKIVPHQKVNAIKAMRFYIMQVTGGPCSLSKTKWAAENLKFFLDHVKAEGLPNMDQGAPDLHKQIPEPPHTVGGVDSEELTAMEQTEIAAIVNKHAPSITYKLTPGDAMVIWVGNYLTSYKVSKEEGFYRVYTEKDGQWAIQNQTSLFHDLKYFLTELLDHIAKALANSKLKQPPVDTMPSLNPDKLSASEVDELKKLIKQFKLGIATSYSKKLMEAASPFPQEAYSVTVSDSAHNVWVKIYKAQGKYVIAKGLKDAYFPLKTFNNFEDLLAYTDYFFNSYIKPESKVGEVEKVPDDQVAQIKDLVKKYYPKAKVRRKVMTSKGEGKVPYVSIDIGEQGNPFLVISKTNNGAYKLFEENASGEWKNLAVTDGWDGMYDLLDKALSGVDITGEKNNPSVLNPEQFEWLETFMKTHKPGVEIKMWGNKVIGGYDPSVKINGESNPLFVIRNSPGTNFVKILQVQTEDGGMGSEEYPFHTFDALAQFIVNNLDVVTQLLKGAVPEQGKLALALANAEFEYKEKKQVSLDHGGTKNATIYENSKGERLYLYDDGSSRMWFKTPTGETYKVELKNVSELLGWMGSHYEGNVPPAAASAPAPAATQKGDWSTGDDTLDYWINETGFHYQGEEETPDHGKKLVFRDVFGTNLIFYVGDKTASLQFPNKKGIGFTNIEDLKAHLETYADKPEAAPDTFGKNAGYAGLLQTLAGTEFKYTHNKPDPSEQPYKIFKRPDGAMVTIWDTGVCAHKAPSDKAEWEYSKSFAELDDKLKKLYDKTPTPSGPFRTEDMPWSGVDYKAVWVKLPPDKTLLLNAVDDDTMSNMGWKRIMLGSGHVYRNGYEQIAFYKSGNANYWSNFKTGGVTQTFPTVEDTLRWLWKNKGSVQTPKVPLVYVSVPLLHLEEEKLKSLGFVRLQNNGVIWYEKPGENQWVMFYKDGHATIKDKITGTEMDYFDTAADAITFLSNKYFKTSAKKQKATGEMPWYGNEYVNTSADNTPIKLAPSDEGTMESIGFSVQMVPSNIGNPLYYYQNKTGHRFYFRTNGESEYADPSNNSQKFKTVKDAMQFAWDKFSVFI